MAGYRVHDDVSRETPQDDFPFLLTPEAAILFDMHTLTLQEFAVRDAWKPWAWRRVARQLNAVDRRKRWSAAEKKRRLENPARRRAVSSQPLWSPRP